jgi:acetylglutamate kinase
MKNVLIKGSGDTLENPNFIKFIEDKAKKNKTVVICGGGTQISNALAKAGYKINYNHLGRVAETKEERNIIKKVLQKEKRKLEKRFSSRNVEIIIPVLKVGAVECHINADNLTKAYYLGFDSIFVFTLKNRSKDKKNIFKDYLRVKIIGI